MHRQITKKAIETIHLPEGSELLLRDTELKGFGIGLVPQEPRPSLQKGASIEVVKLKDVLWDATLLSLWIQREQKLENSCTRGISV